MRRAAAGLLALVASAFPGRAQPNLAAIPAPFVGNLEPAVVEQLARARGAVEQLATGADAAAVHAALGQLCLLYLRYERVDSGAECFRQMRELAPADARWPYYLAVLYQNEARLDEARSLLDEVVARRPDYAPAWVRAGDLAVWAGDWAAAERAYQQALAGEPRSAAARFGLGQVAAALGDEGRALELFAAALVDQPEGSVIHHHRGMAYRALGDATRALEELRQNRQVAVRAADPWLDVLADLNLSREAAFNRGSRALRAGDLEAAAAAFRELLARFPDDAEAHYNLARALGDRGEHVGAEHHLREAVRRAPAYRDAQFNLAVLLGRLGRGDEAAAHLERVVAIDPEHVAARVLWAQVLAGRGELGRAEAELAAALGADPARADARLLLGTLFARRGDLAAAAAAFEAVLALAPAAPRERSRALFQLAVLARRQGGDSAVARARALEHLRAAAALDEAAAEPRAALGEELAAAGAFAEAAPHLRAWSELAPEEPRARASFARVLLHLGSYREARAALEAGLERIADDLPLTDLLARLLATCPDAAIRDGARAVALAGRVVERAPTIDRVETLAMALAEVGRFEEAARWQRQALAQEERTAGAVSPARQRRLALYLEQQPVRAPWPELAPP